MLSDLRLSLRALAKARGFAVVAVLTLAVGIGSTTAIFSVLQALVISPFSYPRSDQLVHVWSGDRWPLSPADFLDLRAECSSFSAFGTYRQISSNVGADNAQAVPGISGTVDVLRAFGVQPVLGRLFEPAEDEEGAAAVVILSHALWQQRFGGDPEVIGRALRVDGVDAKVVGVLPADFEFVSPWMRTQTPQLWVPAAYGKQERTQRDSHYLLGIARLREGVSVAQAEAEVKTIGKRLKQQYPNSNSRKEFLVRSLHDEITRDLAKQVWTLFAAVGLVLLVACGNVASMLLARSARRQGEFAVRTSLGASRGHLVRLALAESLVLAAAGAVLGVLFAYAGVEALRALSPVSATRKAAIALDFGALGFALASTVFTALVAGLPPAFAAMRTSVATLLRSDARGSVGSRDRHRMLRSLIIAQVALAFVLANGAVLLSSGYLKMLRDSAALSTDAVCTAQIALNGPRYTTDEQRVRFWNQYVERVRALPGVTQAGITSKLPLEGGNNMNALVNDETYDPTAKRMLVERSSVTPDYFASMGIRFLKGRGLQKEDSVGDIRGVVVNHKLVEKAWPNKDPIGEIIRSNTPGKPWFTGRVVGVVEGVKQWGAREEIQPEMYTGPEGHWGRTAILVLRSSLPLEQLAPMLKRELAEMDSELALKELRTMRKVVETATQGERAVTSLVNFFMATALGLVAVGLYGTLSYHVQQRTREIGVRVAMGALRGHILSLVFGQGSRWVAVGLVLGLAGSAALASTVKSLLYQTQGLSVPPLVLATCAVGLTTLVACWLPARRAARLDPMQALKTD